MLATTTTTSTSTILCNVPVQHHQIKQQQQQPHRQSLPTVTTTLCCENQATGNTLSPLSPGTTTTNATGSNMNITNPTINKDSINNFFTTTNLPGITTNPNNNSNNNNNRTRDMTSLSSGSILTNHQQHEITSPSSINKSGAGSIGGGGVATTSISPPKINLLIDRRPSAGANVIPHAALCQHRHSLQINGDGGVYRVCFFLLNLLALPPT